MAADPDARQRIAKPRVLIVGPVAPVGGMAQFIRLVTTHEESCEWHTHSTYRGEKTEKRGKGVGYGQLTSGGLGRLLASGAKTIGKILIYPWVVLAKRTQVCYLTFAPYLVFWEMVFYTIWSRLLFRPILAHQLGPLDQFYEASPGWVRWIIRRTVLVADGHLVLTHGVANMLRSWGCKAPIDVVPSAVDVDYYCPGEGPREEGHEPFLLFMGGARPRRKGIDLVVEAFIRIADRFPDLRLKLSGGDEIYPFEQPLSEVGLAGRADLVGFVDEDEKLEYMRTCHLFLLPSRMECVPYAIIEAMACGAPVVGSDIGGIPETIVENETGRIVPNEDVDALAEAMEAILADDELRARMARQARERAVAEYSLDAAMAKVGAMTRYVFRPSEEGPGQSSSASGRQSPSS
jgi:glycosyltransferase involved in cell wall biosynthesis